MDHIMGGGGGPSVHVYWIQRLNVRELLEQSEMLGIALKMRVIKTDSTQ